MIPETKLERVLDRFHAVEAELARGGGESYARLSKEHAELAPLVETISAYKIAAKELSDAQGLLGDAEPEMRALAEEEKLKLERRLKTLEQDLKIQLLPKDTADASSAIIEIRAGTGDRKSVV